MAFDLADIPHSKQPSHHSLWNQLRKKSLEFARSRGKPAMPIKDFQVSEVSQAIKHFTLGTRIRKVVSMEDLSGAIKLVHERYDTILPHETLSHDPSSTL